MRDCDLPHRESFVVRLARHQPFTPGHFTVLGFEVPVQPGVSLKDERFADLRVTGAPGHLHGFHVAGPSVCAVFHDRDSYLGGGYRLVMHRWGEAVRDRGHTINRRTGR